MKIIVVASQNPVKVKAIQNGFHRMFPEDQFTIQTVSVPSGVRDQPLSSDETLAGACNRSRGAALRVPGADYWVGIEGGIAEQGHELCAFAWIFIHSNELEGKARTGTFFLPPAVADLIRAGKELGEADDIVFQKSNSKQENGAIGLLTGNIIDRAQLYEHAVILALVVFKNPNLYPAQAG